MKDSRERCPISQTLFDCATCDCVGKKDGKCPYFVFDDAIEYTLKFLRKRAAGEIKSKNENR